MNTKNPTFVTQATALIRNIIDEYVALSATLEKESIHESERALAAMYVAEDILGTTRLALDLFFDGRFKRAQARMQEAKRAYKMMPDLIDKQLKQVEYDKGLSAVRFADNVLSGRVAA